MANFSTYTIHSSHQQLGWSRDQALVRTVAPGEVLGFETIDASGGQIDPQSTEEAVTRMDPCR